MNDCVDSFTTGQCCGGCGCTSCHLDGLKVVFDCGCNCNGDSQNTCDGRIEVKDSKGSCTPIIRDGDHIISGDCKREQGGTKTIGAPQYALTVRNPDDFNASAIVWETTQGQRWSTTQKQVWSIANAN